MTVPCLFDEHRGIALRARRSAIAAGVSVRRARSRHRARNDALRVELDVEQVRGREPFPGHESIADDARPRADLVVAVAEHVQHVAVHDAGVRGPDASALGIADARILGRASASRSSRACRRPTTAAAGRRIRRAAESIHRRSSRYVPARRRRRSSVRARQVRSPRRRSRPRCAPFRARPRRRRAGRRRARPSASRAAVRGNRARGPDPRSSTRPADVRLVRPATSITSS